MYWKRRQVKAALNRWSCKSYALDGCMYGQISQAARTKGSPLRKPWTIASSHTHVPTQGTDTRLTEEYTPQLATAIHDCWRIYCADPGSATTNNTNTTTSPPVQHVGSRQMT